MRTVELHPELAACVSKDETFTMIRHPLVHTLFMGTDMEIQWANESLALKREAVMQALSEGDFGTAIWMHERPYRLSVLKRVPTTAPDYWSLVARVWLDTEYPSNAIDDWVEILSHPDAHLMMDDDERQVYDALPDEVEIYRGVGPDAYEDSGISFTLSIERARWFANRFSEDGHVLTRTVPRAEIVAYLNGRNESEVIVLT
jgi:hypothetical protein